MTDEPKPITGFVAWHPEKGTFGDGLFLFKTPSGAKGQWCRSHYYIHGPHVSLVDVQKEFDAEGWQLRPVELRFTDEPKPIDRELVRRVVELHDPDSLVGGFLTADEIIAKIEKEQN